MSLIQRVQAILLQPKETWPVIAQEGGDAKSLYTGYVMILAAIPAIAGFIGLSLIGAGAFGFSVRIPIATGVLQMLVSWVLSLVMVFVVALIVDALAPTFGGSRSQFSALKLVAYGSTAGFVGGIFSLIPMLSILGLIAALYSIYLIYTGLPVLMRCPPAKAGAYTAVVILCGIVAMVVLAAVSALFTPAARAARRRHRRRRRRHDQDTGRRDQHRFVEDERDGAENGRGRQAHGGGAEVGRQRCGRQGDGRDDGRARRRRADRRAGPEGAAAREPRRHEARLDRGPGRPGDGHRRLVGAGLATRPASAGST